MKKLIVLCMLLMTVACAGTQVVKPDPDTYTYTFDKWQTFFYQDDDKTGLIMYQVKYFDLSKVPGEFKVGDTVFKIKLANPKIEVPK